MNVLGHFCYPSGLQLSVRSVVDSLRMMDIPVQCRDVPVGLDSDVAGHGHHLGLDLHEYTLIHVQPEPFFNDCYPRAGLHPRAHSGYRMAMWYWEFGEIPPEWKERAKTLQEIWAPTRFIADAFRRSLSLPVTPMLPGVRLSSVKEVAREDYGIPEGRTVFLFIFNMRSIMERKNPLDLIKSFQTAFKHDDRASLVIKVSCGKENPREFAKLQSAATEAGAILIDGTLPRDEVNGLIQACDCYVSLHRSEGLGLTMAESMLLGKPVIATNYSGNTDFMSVDDSLLVDYRLVPLEHDIPPYKKGQLWAAPSCEQAAHWMRWVYCHRDEAKDLGQRGREAAEKVLSMEASGQRLLKRLTEIHEMQAG
jgi:glycosyltransferase involved in cell wall biosynthesis